MVVLIGVVVILVGSKQVTKGTGMVVLVILIGLVVIFAGVLTVGFSSWCLGSNR